MYVVAVMIDQRMHAFNDLFYSSRWVLCVGTGLEAECHAVKLAFRFHLNYGVLLWFELETYIGLKLDWQHWIESYIYRWVGIRVRLCYRPIQTIEVTLMYFSYRYILSTIFSRHQEEIFNVIRPPLFCPNVQLAPIPQSSSLASNFWGLDANKGKLISRNDSFFGIARSQLSHCMQLPSSKT